MAKSQETIKDMIQKQFDRTDSLSTKSIAFIHVCVKDKDGLRYGSYQYVREEQLKGRDFEYEFLDGKPGILLLDTLFDTDTWKTINHL